MLLLCMTLVTLQTSSPPNTTGTASNQNILKGTQAFCVKRKLIAMHRSQSSFQFVLPTANSSYMTNTAHTVAVEPMSLPHILQLHCHCTAVKQSSPHNIEADGGRQAALRAGLLHFGACVLTPDLCRQRGCGEGPDPQWGGRHL